MRILVLSEEVWNDILNGNHITTSWFEGMEAEFANIYASPGIPCNSCCRRYFQITDRMMLESLLGKKKAGKQLECSGKTEGGRAEEEPQWLYNVLRKISGNWLRAIRELLWSIGIYDRKAMQQFLEEFQPDVIFSERRASSKMLRLERTVLRLWAAPMFAFTGDDEYSLKQCSLSPFFWLRRFAVRKQLRQNVKRYEIYYTLSLEQKEYYERIFGCRCKLLYKCGDHRGPYQEHRIHNPIRLIYAGKFYCNRWRVLGQIASVLREINADAVKMTLEIYTRDMPNARQNRLLNDGRSSFIKGAVSQEELRRLYQEADVALHVESLDIKNRLATRWSFSTKIVDCLFSGCAVMAYCWERHSGFTYLQRENAAICVSSARELKKTLEEICDHPEMIRGYSYRAYRCALRNHERKHTQKMLLEDFREACRKTAASGKKAEI